MSMKFLEVVPYYHYHVEEFTTKKSIIMDILQNCKAERYDCFTSDREIQTNSYAQSVFNLITDEIQKFGEELSAKNISISNMWHVKYDKGDYHPVHSHRGKGYTGILYVNYDSSVHSPTYYVNAYSDPVTEKTTFSRPEVEEGDLVFVHSSILHYTRPNISETPKIIISFDMDVTR